MLNSTPNAALLRRGAALGRGRRRPETATPAGGMLPKQLPACSSGVAALNSNWSWLSSTRRSRRPSVSGRASGLLGRPPCGFPSPRKLTGRAAPAEVLHGRVFLPIDIFISELTPLLDGNS